MSSPTCLRVSTEDSADMTVLTAAGVLNSTTYLPLRDEIIKAAVAGPSALILDVSELSVPVASAWMVFVNAHCEINVWRDVPMALACRHQSVRNAIWRNGLTRYLTLYSSLSEAIAETPGAAPLRRRASTELTAMPDTATRARLLIDAWLTQWSKTEFIAAATTVATVFIENFISQSRSTVAKLRVETDGTGVTVAIDDPNPEPVDLCAICSDVPGATGKEVVRILSRKWGSIGTGSGKTVWAVIGPGN